MIMASVGELLILVLWTNSTAQRLGTLVSVPRDYSRNNSRGLGCSSWPQQLRPVNDGEPGNPTNCLTVLMTGLVSAACPKTLWNVQTAVDG